MSNEATGSATEVDAESKKSPYAGWSVNVGFVMNILDNIDNQLMEACPGESEMQAQQILHSIATIRTVKSSLLKGFSEGLLDLLNDKDFLVDQLLNDEGDEAFNEAIDEVSEKVASFVQRSEDDSV